ncbi:MAG: SH3 domain-containing protein [Kiritimatiellae bacterium]|nr:SH3 domain-containing protein [Kiritimatiellia bacterium]
MRLQIVKIFLLTLLPLYLAAGELISGRIYTKPEKIYVNQPFEIFLEVEITPGQEIENIRIQGFPSDPSFITLGQLEQGGRRSHKTSEGQAADVLSFHARARCHKSLSLQFSPILTCNVVQRRSRSFFSFSSSSSGQLRIAPFKLIIQELPQLGRPADFSGAIGTFKLQATLSKTRVRPGDIITLKQELSGAGWLNNAPMPPPLLSGEFKSYPAKESLRQDHRITTEQIIIPLTTNALAIGAARFNYFNPQSEQYESSTSPQFKLHFLAAANNIATNQIKVISTERDPVAALTSAASINIHEVNELFRQILPAIVGCLFILVASFAFLVLIKIHKWLAFAAVTLILATGAIAAFKAARHEPEVQIELQQTTPVYLAPSITSPVIMQLRTSTKVRALESAEGWIRVESAGQRGWIERGHLAE